MAYRNDHEYAIIEGDHIMYKGRAVSPNQFASCYADSVRNATPHPAKAGPIRNAENTVSVLKTSPLTDRRHSNLPGRYIFEFLIWRMDIVHSRNVRHF